MARRTAGGWATMPGAHGKQRSRRSAVARLGAALAPLTLAALLAGCAHPSDNGPGPAGNGGGSGDSGSVSAASPSVENTHPDADSSPGDHPGGGPSIETVGLPVGGGND